MLKNKIKLISLKNYNYNQYKLVILIKIIKVTINKMNNKLKFKIISLMRILKKDKKNIY